MARNVYRLKLFLDINSRSCILDSNGVQIKIICQEGKHYISIEDMPPSELDENIFSDIARKIDVIKDFPVGTFLDEHLDALLVAKGANVPEIKAIESGIELFPGSENLEYNLQMVDLFSKVCARGSERFLELAFLHNLYFRSKASVDRINLINGFEDFLVRNGFDIEGIMMTALGSTGRGFAIDTSDIEIGLFDQHNIMEKYGRWPDIILQRQFNEYLRMKGFQQGVAGTDASVKYVPALNFAEHYNRTTFSQSIGNIFCYCFYGDFYSVRKEIMCNIREEQFEDAMNSFLIFSTILERHQARFMSLLNQRNECQILPLSLKLPVTMEYLFSIRPKLEEFRKMYS